MSVRRRRRYTLTQCKWVEELDTQWKWAVEWEAQEMQDFSSKNCHPWLRGRAGVPTWGWTTTTYLDHIKCGSTNCHWCILILSTHLWPSYSCRILSTAPQHHYCSLSTDIKGKSLQALCGDTFSLNGRILKSNGSKCLWSRRLACTTCGGGCKRSWLLLTLTFVFSLLRSLLFTHFGDSQEADFLWTLIFWPN